MSQKDQMDKLGYGKEEEYFYKHNRELIEKRRKELDRQRQEGERQAKHAHWMKCPKCGGSLKEIDLTGVKVDQCGQCQGIYFDAGELDLVLQARESGGFFRLLKDKLL